MTLSKVKEMSIKEKLAELEAERKRNSERVVNWGISQMENTIIENTELSEVKAELEKTRKELKRCVNELCYRCGKYQNEHLGACSGCKWRVIRNGDT